MKPKSKLTKRVRASGMDDRIFAAARVLKDHGFDDVIGVLMRGQARVNAETRVKRPRGVHVRLGHAHGPKAFLDESRINAMSVVE